MSQFQPQVYHVILWIQILREPVQHIFSHPCSVSIYKNHHKERSCSHHFTEPYKSPLQFYIQYCVKCYEVIVKHLSHQLEHWDSR